MSFIERRMITLLQEYCQVLDLTCDELEIQCLKTSQDEVHGLCLPDSDHVLVYYIHHNDGEIEFYLPTQIE